MKWAGYALFTLALLAIIYARHGYVFGSSDQSETLPYVLWLNNHSLYPSDFYLQSIIQHPFNERRFFVEFLRFFSNHLSWSVFFLHLLATASLIWGIYFYARKRFNSFSTTWFAILLPLLFVYDINTGSVELDENTFNPSYLANVLALWVFILHDYRKTFWAVLLIAFITFLQPLIGALLALVFFLSETTLLILISSGKKNPAETKRLIGCYVFYIFTAGVYLYSLSHQISASSDANLLMQIIAMRAPHHYFPDQFSLIGYVFMFACVIAIFKYGSMNEHLWTFFIVAGCIVYSVGVYYFESHFILNTQFFRMTMWIKLWGTMAMVRWFFAYLENDKPMRFIDKHFKTIIFLGGSFSAIIILPSTRIFKNKDYMFPFFKNTDAIVEISERAKNATPNDALFITPPDFEAFRFYSERSNFVDYKAILHDNAFLVEWQKRLKKVYDIGIENKEKGFKLIPIAKTHYNALSDSTLVQLCTQNHIGYVIRDNAFPIHSGFNKIDSTAYYAIYIKKTMPHVLIKDNK